MLVIPDNHSDDGVVSFTHLCTELYVGWSSEAERRGLWLDRLSSHLSSLDTFSITGFVETNPQQLRESQLLLTPTGRTGGFIMMGIRNALERRNGNVPLTMAACGSPQDLFFKKVSMN